jgi:hypothetical protein
VISDFKNKNSTELFSGGYSIKKIPGPVSEPGIIR